LPLPTAQGNLLLRGGRIYENVGSSMPRVYPNGYLAKKQPLYCNNANKGQEEQRYYHYDSNIAF
jgi:hypothetical protein